MDERLIQQYAQLLERRLIAPEDLQLEQCAALGRELAATGMSVAELGAFHELAWHRLTLVTNDPALARSLSALAAPLQSVLSAYFEGDP